MKVRSTPGLRVLTEGAVIVVSILLAFAIDAWWDRLQSEERERGYLEALREEFVATLEAERSSGARRVATHSIEALIAQIQGADRAPLDSLFYWASGTSWAIEFDPHRAVFDDLVSSGGTQLIRSDSLRLALTRYGRMVQMVRHSDDQAWATWEQRIQPLFEGRIPRVERIRRGIFRRSPFGPSPHEADWEAVLADPAFEDALAERWLRLQVSSTRIQETLAQIDAIVRLIEEELDAG